MTIEVLEKKVSDLVSLVQEKIDKSASKSEIDELTDKASKAVEELNQIKVSIQEKEKRIDELEKKLARGFNGGLSDQNIDKKYRRAFNLYLRKGTPIDETLKKEFHEKYVRDFASDNMTDEEIKDQISLLNQKTDASQNGYFYLPDHKTILSSLKNDFENKTLQVGVNPDGGYFVQPQRLSNMVDRFFETSNVRAFSTVQTTSTESVEMIIDDEAFTSGGWVAETSARSVTNNAQIGLLTIHTHEQYAMPRATQKMLDDAGFNIEAWINAKVQDIINRTENTSFVSGNGVNKPKGFLSYADWAVAGTYERDALERINSGAATNVTADGLIDLQFSLLEPYQANAFFAMARNTLRECMKLKEATTGAYLIDRQLLRNGGPFILLGKPVTLWSDMPALSAGSDSIAYGDFRKGYMVVDRIGFRALRDPYTSKPYVLFYVTKRVGGAVTNYEAIKIQNTSL